MTPVEFLFLTPDDQPVVEALVDIQLMQPVFDDLDNGVLMPRLISVTTDEEGKVTVNLRASSVPYQVVVNDPVSEAGLSYKFIVPELTPPLTSVRLQDIILEGELPTQVPYDAQALQVILTAKANALGAMVAVQQMEAEVKLYRDSAAGLADAAQASADSVQGSAINAGIAREGAEVAEGHASASEQNAKASETAASISEGKAKTSEQNALDAKTAAGLSQTAAKTSETNAKTSETNSKASETAAAVSATAANDSKIAAAGSATASEQSKVTSVTKAGEAVQSANDADASKRAAANSAQAALTSAQNADTSSKAAADSLTAVNQRLSDATTQANLSKDWATKVGAEVTQGQGYSAKQEALNSAAEAVKSKNSATAAATSEGNAAGSASSAQASSTTANQRATDAATSKTGADTAAQLARDWATKDTVVAAGLQSAKTYADQAKASAQTAASAASSAISGQVQADWNETDSSQKGFIVNKPVIPAPQRQADWNQTDNSQPDFIRNKIAAAIQAAFSNGAASSVVAADIRNVSNPTTGIGYGSGMRVRFGHQNDTDPNGGYADIIDLSTYHDASAGGFNSLYFRKDQQRITHKYAAANGNSWTEKVLAYVGDLPTKTSQLTNDTGFITAGSSITGNAATATYAQNSTRLYASDANYGYGSGNPYYLSMSYNQTSNRWRLSASPNTPTSVEVSYADTAGTANTATTANSLKGIGLLDSGVGGHWPGIPRVNTDGVMEIGSTIDFHNADGDGADYKVRLNTGGTSDQLFINGCKVLHDSNYNIYAPTLDGLNAHGTWNISIQGFARSLIDATNGYTLSFNWQGNQGQPNWVWGANAAGQNYVWNPANFNVTGAQWLTTDRTNYKSTNVENNVVGQLMWKNYGNMHTIFDASAGTSPTGIAVDLSLAQNPWIPHYPTLMGWNGDSTYGVRVDSARIADTLAAGSYMYKPTIRGYIEQMQWYNSGAGLTINTDNGTLVEIVVNQNTTITLPPASPGISFTLILIYSGAYTVSFAGGTSIRWAGNAIPKATSVSGRIDVYSFICGSTYTIGRDGGRNA